jgi:hypothetical protein
MVEMLPAGLYEMTISDREPGYADDELITNRYRVKFAERTVCDPARSQRGLPDGGSSMTETHGGSKISIHVVGSRVGLF